MKDRVPVNPGRVRIVPENGSAAYYATMERADNPTQEGTPINKNTLLKDATAALFGLDENAVPDDVFVTVKNQAPFLSDFVWKRRSYQLRTEPEITSYSLDISGGTRYRAKNYTVDYSTGIFTLVDASTTSQNVSCRGYYWIVGSRSGTIMYYSASDASFSDSYIKVDEYSAAPIIGEWEYIKDASRNAYPDSGVVNGYEYAYHGIAKELMFVGAKIATGSYAGNGKSGAGNANSITLSFPPKAGIVFSASNSAIGSGSWGSYDRKAMFIVNGAALVIPDSQYDPHISISGNTVKWEGYNASDQMNINGRTYRYIFFG